MVNSRQVAGKPLRGGIMHEIPGNERAHLLYLSQIDAQLTTFTNRSVSFFPDLVNRLLPESGAVITDVFFFISPEVAFVVLICLFTLIPGNTMGVIGSIVASTIVAPLASVTIFYIPFFLYYVFIAK